MESSSNNRRPRPSIGVHPVNTLNSPAPTHPLFQRPGQHSKARQPIKIAGLAPAKPYRLSSGSNPSSLLGDDSDLFDEVAQAAIAERMVKERDPAQAAAPRASQPSSSNKGTLGNSVTASTQQAGIGGPEAHKSSSQNVIRDAPQFVPPRASQPPTNAFPPGRPPADHNQRSLNNLTSSAPRFGESSPLRNPLKKDGYSHLFNPNRGRPELHRAPQDRQSQKPLSTASSPSLIEIPRPSNFTPQTIYPPPRPTFSSLDYQNDFRPINNAPAKSQIIDLTKPRGSDDEFDPDAALRDTKFGAVDPYDYVDAGKAQENIKALLEGAFDDEEEIPRTRLGKKKKKLQETSEEVANTLAEKLKALEVKAKEEDEKKEDKDEDEDEDDGSVDGLTVKLLPHQVEGVSWMMNKEIGLRKKNGVLPHGGILADDMGLGKTVQSLALIMSNPRPSLEEAAKDTKRKISPKVSKGTLVVAPLALIKQWESEIKSKVEKTHTLKVLVHHGQSRTKSFKELEKYDVVITTYQILSSEHASSSDTDDGPKIGCFGIRWYRVILDEAHTIKNRNAKMTQACYALRSHYRWCLTGTPMQNNLDELQSLIKFLQIKPYNELKSWKDQITGPMKNGRGGLAMRRLQYFLKAFMKRRTKDILKKEGALNPGGKTKEGQAKSGGLRIVERNVETVVIQFSSEERRFYDRLAAKAESRLAEMLTGEKTDYIGALVLLLRLRQACNHPDLIQSNMKSDKDALETGTTVPPTPSRAKAADKDMDDLAAVLGGLSVEVKQCDVCLIDLKQSEVSAGAVRCADCEEDLQLQKRRQKKLIKKSKEKRRESKAKRSTTESPKPQKPAVARHRRVIVDSDEEEEENGEWIVPESEQSIPDLGKAGGTDDEDAEGGGEWLKSDDSFTDNEQKSRSKKVVSLESDDEEKSTNDDSSDQDSDADSDDEDDSDQVSDASGHYVLSSHSKSDKIMASTKIRHMIKILRKETPDHKVIVFSQFTSMLDLVEPFLKRGGFSFTRYDGSMRNDHREASLNKLRNDPATRVLLCSLKCGSLGLNLTAASRVIILEPFWNPFVEEQAIDRVHRLNQTVDVTVYRLTIEKTVEERILELQEAKRKLANAAIEGGKAAKLSMKDILNLFRTGAEYDGSHESKDDSSIFKNTKVLRDNASQSSFKDVYENPTQDREKNKAIPRKGWPRPDDPIYGRR